MCEWRSHLCFLKKWQSTKSYKSRKSKGFKVRNLYSFTATVGEGGPICDSKNFFNCCTYICGLYYCKSSSSIHHNFSTTGAEAVKDRSRIREEYIFQDSSLIDKIFAIDFCRKDRRHECCIMQMEWVKNLRLLARLYYSSGQRTPMIESDYILYRTNR
jgi:hypothetical protein